MKPLRLLAGVSSLARRCRRPLLGAALAGLLRARPARGVRVLAEEGDPSQPRARDHPVRPVRRERRWRPRRQPHRPPLLGGRGLGRIRERFRVPVQRPRRSVPCGRLSVDLHHGARLDLHDPLAHGFRDAAVRGTGDRRRRRQGCHAGSAGLRLHQRRPHRDADRAARARSTAPMPRSRSAGVRSIPTARTPIYGSACGSMATKTTSAPSPSAPSRSRAMISGRGTVPLRGRAPCPSRRSTTATVSVRSRAPPGTFDRRCPTPPSPRGS